MFEDYLQDAFSFFYKAQSSINDNNEREARMYYRATVFCAASSIEAFVNFIGDTFLKGNTLDKIEIAFLNDEILEIAPSKATIESNTKYYAIDSKIKFIIRKFNVNIDLSSSKCWLNFLDLKKFRDSLVHPRNDEDIFSITDYTEKTKNGLNSNIEIMNEISKKIFNKPLRQNLIDLKL